jgi:hypothetical protein
MFYPTARFKELFFDRDAVMNAVEDARRRVLTRAGAFIRRTAVQSIRPGVRSVAGVRKHSRPGKPPKSWTGLLKNFIWFGYDSATRSVVIGPARLGGRNQGEAPHTLEYGGTAGIREYQLSGGLWVRQAPKRLRAGRPTRIQNVRIAPRPFMGPSLRKNLPKLPGLWENSIRA